MEIYNYTYIYIYIYICQSVLSSGRVVLDPHIQLRRVNVGTFAPQNRKKTQTVNRDFAFFELLKHKDWKIQTAKTETKNVFLRLPTFTTESPLAAAVIGIGFTLLVLPCKWTNTWQHPYNIPQNIHKFR